MFKEFLNSISKESLFTPEDAVLIAVSGGIDSVVLLELFHRLRQEVPEFNQLKIGLAHCNFKLRGIESDQEESFVRDLAIRFNSPFYVQHFDTTSVATDEKISIQMAARMLRYDWFETIRKENNYRYIAVAHHQNDVVETVLINLLKGTGIAGLHGIAPKKGSVIRPLLFATRENIHDYAIEKNIAYKEDSSNASTKYIRNKLRHDVIPILKELNPGLEKTFQQNIAHIKDIEIIFNQFVEEKRKEIISCKEQTIYIDIEKIKIEPSIFTLLFEFLKPYNFNAGVVEDIVQSINNQSGKLFYSPTHRLLKDRKYLLITLNKPEVESVAYKIDQHQTEHTEGIHLTLKIKQIDKQEELLSDSSMALLDVSKLKFPLTLRKWEIGDWFYPLGMNNKKNISDFFIDKKVSVIEKENTWVLISGKDIVWLVGHRIDNRYKITDGTNSVCCIKEKTPIKRQ